ncbi:serine proteinase stubble isoform X2 [Zootermopsis nevadensis]|uniref:serine proteinase stubble isoform X2 n=1 Tax=Zootermopsis nevadensis TaxID=136037 RepID=UPI000B8E3164|nr:serine proteinase stubble isoform X2 [Zootermopsis nevadensis]
MLAVRIEDVPHHGTMSCVPQGALLALLAAILHCTMTSPVWMPQFLSGGSGRNIRHLPCVSRRTGETGVCMFAFGCMKANGTHLGTCIDRFYFGSCCRLQEENGSSIPNTEDNNVLPVTTTTEFKYYLSTFQSIQDSDNNVEDDDQPTVKPIRPVILPTKKPSVPEKRPTPSPTTITTSGPLTTRKSTIFTSTAMASPTLPTYKPFTTDKLTTTITRKPVVQVTSQTTSNPVSKPTKPPKTTTKQPVTQILLTQTTTREPVIQTGPSGTTDSPVTQQTSPSTATTKKPITPPKNTTRKPVIQTSSYTTTTGRPVTEQTEPLKTTTREPSTQDITTKATPLETTTKKLVTQTESPYTTTTRAGTQSSPLDHTTRKTTAQTKPSETTTRRPATQSTSETTTRRPTTQSTSETTTRRPVTQSTSETTTRRPVTHAKPPETTTRTSVTQTTSQKITEKPPVTKPKPPAATTSKKPVVTTTRKPPTKKPTIKTTESPAETTTTSTLAPASLITWTLLQEPPRTESASTTTAASDGWILINVTTHPPSVDSTSQVDSALYNNTSQPAVGTTTSMLPDIPPDITTTSTLITTTMTTTTTRTTFRPEVTVSTTDASKVTSEDTPTTNATQDFDLNMTDFVQVCGRRLFPESRIVGGEKSSFGKWPWQISLRQWRTSTYLHKCGAALLNENWAITAAHCVENVPPSDLLLRLGEHDLSSEEEPYGYQERRVQIVASHPQFDARTFEYDLALLRFYEPVTFQPNILPVCVPHDDTNFVGHTAYVTGWGRLYEDGPLPSVLQEVSVPVINNSLCETMYRSAGYIEHIPEIFICAGWKKGGFDSCEGDSGGPMVIQRPDKRWLLAGVISWGIGCAEPNQPGVYTRISEFREWINQILQF